MGAFHWPREDPGAKEMSRDGDGMGDVIRKAAGPAREGSYKKVRDKKESFVCPQLPLWQEETCQNAARHPPRALGFRCWSRKMLSGV